MMASGRRPPRCGRRGCACGSPSGVIILTGRWLMALTRQRALSLRFRRVWVREQTVAFTLATNLARGRPIISVASALPIGLGLHRLWCEQVAHEGSRAC